MNSAASQETCMLYLDHFPIPPTSIFNHMLNFFANYDRMQNSFKSSSLKNFPPYLTVVSSFYWTSKPLVLQ